MVKNLEGDKLTSIDITYQRGGEKKQSNVMRGYSVKSVYHEIIGTTGYIRITSFMKIRQRSAGGAGCFGKGEYQEHRR